VNHEPPTLNENDLVEFTAVSTDKGLSAEDVTIVREAPNY
jgi:cold shock CspA family protein